MKYTFSMWAILFSVSGAWADGPVLETSIPGTLPIPDQVWSENSLHLLVADYQLGLWSLKQLRTQDYSLAAQSNVVASASLFYVDMEIPHCGNIIAVQSPRSLEIHRGGNLQTRADFSFEVGESGNIQRTVWTRDCSKVIWNTTSSGFRGVYIGNLNDGSVIRSEEGWLEGDSRLALSQGGTHVVKWKKADTSSALGEIYDTSTGEFVGRLETPDETVVEHLQYSVDDLWIDVYSDDGKVLRYPNEDDFDLTPDSERRVFQGDVDGDFTQLRSGNLLIPIRGQNPFVFNPWNLQVESIYPAGQGRSHWTQNSDGTWIAAIGRDVILIHRPSGRTWTFGARQVEEGRETGPSAPDRIESVAFSPDSRKLSVGYWSGLLQIYSIE